MNRKILVGISGGVDSSVAIYLLKQQGCQPVGITLKVIDDTSESKFDHEIERTQKLCKKLNIQHIVKQVQQEFFDEVITDFVNTYLDGETPNPCVICNRTIKWRFLLSVADEMGIDKVATGHYVIIKENNGIYTLHQGMDEKKDQSYMLWQLTQKELSRTVFPLGELTKNEVKKIAKEHSLVSESLSESQDICFIPENDYRQYLQRHFPDKLAAIGKGEMINAQGEVLGYHDGFYNFTIGQRKGFKMGFNERKYVKKLDAENNRIIITDNDELFSDGLTLKNINFPTKKLPIEFAGDIQIRYNSKPVPCRGKLLEDDKAEIIFDKPQRAVTPGQSAVMFDGDEVIMGGLIKDII